MVIFNGESQKYAPKHLRSDNIVLDITSDHSLSDVLSMVESNNPLPEGTTIKSYVPAGKEPRYLVDQPQEERPDPWNNEYLTEEAIIEMDDDFYEESELLKSYRPFRNGVLSHRDSFVSFTPDQNLLTTEIQDALGILPTVMDIDEPVKERIRLSSVGNDLFWHFNDEEGEISEVNNYPDLETIRYYDKFTPYEKRIVTEGHIHPRKFVELKKQIEETVPGYLLTRKAFDVMKDEESDYYIEGSTPIYQRGSTLTLAQVKDQLLHPSMAKQRPDELARCIEKSKEVFRQEIGRFPRVIDEYVLAHCLLKGHILTNDEIRDMVKDFSLPSLSKVARFHNFALYALADKIRFQETPKEHIEAFASFLDPDQILNIESRGFFDWYNTHKDIKTADLMTVMESVNEIGSFDVTKSVEELIYDIRQNRGKKDAEKFLYEGADFRNTDLSIRGRNIEVTDGKYTILMLDANDYRNLLVGYDTHCCQRYGEAGESCVRDIIESPTSGITAIVRNRDMKDGKWISGKCLAQAYTWVNEENSTIVFDNMEFADDRKVSEFSDLIAGWAASMPYQNVHVGSGYNQGMNGWGVRVPHTVDHPGASSYVYSDYHEDARALKKDGEMMLSISNPDRLTISERTLVPSRYDILTDPRVAWVAHVENLSMPMRMRLAEDFIAHPDDPTVQMNAVREYPGAIRYIEHPDLSVQQRIVERNPAYVSYIRHPDPSVYLLILRQEPRAILHMDHPSKEAWTYALEKDGLLLQNCPEMDRDLVLTAVKQNGIAIRFAGNLQNDPEIQKEAVLQNPLALKHITNPTQDVTTLAARRDMDSISKNIDLPVETQMELVCENPVHILNFKDSADPAVIRKALELNGLLLRNFRNADHDLQLTAVQSNGLAIRYIREPDEELLRAAYEQNPRSLRYMRISPAEKQELLQSIEER